MPVAVLIPGPLRQFTGGQSRVTLEGSLATVSDALDALGRIHPGVRDRVVTEEGAVRPHVNLFVGADNIRDVDGLATPVPDGGEIAILPAVSGG